MGQALKDLLAKEPTAVHENMEGLVQSIVQRQLKNEEKRKHNEIVKEALKEARKNSSGGERARKPSAKTRAMANRKMSHQKTQQAPISLQNMRRKSTRTTQTGNMPNGSIGSRTLTGAKAHHTGRPTTTTIRLDRACQEDVVTAKAEVEEAPTEVKEEGADGIE
jgi:hypothetical protein